MSSRYLFLSHLYGKLLLISVLALLLGAEVVLGASYYVATNGSDAHPGTQAFPWRTITKAANSLIAGDIVFIASGTYSERLIPQHSGTPGNSITYTTMAATMAGKDVVIDGAAITLPSNDAGLVHIEGKEYITISGLHINNAGPDDNSAGIYVDNSNHITIEKNSTYNTTSSGIGVWNSTNIIIDANEVELACNDGEQESITVASTDGFEIKNNHVHHNGPGTLGGEGIDAKDGSSNGRIYGNYVHDLTRLGIYIDAWNKYTHDIEIYNNRVKNCQNDGITLASEMGGFLENIAIVNNIVTNNLYSGISITPNGEVEGPPMRNLSVINNTIHGNGDGSVPTPWGGGIAIDNPNIDTLVIRNNIFSQNLLFQILIEVQVAGLSVDHNLLYGFRGYDNEITGSEYVVGNPYFIDANNDDYHLSSISPAIDSGSPLGAPPKDFDSVKRPKRSGYDLGAFEFNQLPSQLVPGMLLLLYDK